MHLRLATHLDAAAVAQIYLASRKTFLSFAPLAHSDEEVRAWVEHLLLPSGSVTVAEFAGEIVGFVATSNADGCLWIDQLYVQPGAVGQGAGTALLTHALDGVAYPVRLRVFQVNSGARRLYERFGFVPIVFTDGADNEERCPDVLYERRVDW
ncbi:GNAT family N-acetyltransferase [Andreprevotia chitinilytica]|uniref:GNAT family N-acetyltransferase n=1 Tax=Andreprevotia chitinilytica TaxID=396808 RepID=UPI00068D8E6B|nr:GNAT family N-acetyltransferase [Andreprevotia chitinilytica]